MSTHINITPHVPPLPPTLSTTSPHVPPLPSTPSTHPHFLQPRPQPRLCPCMTTTMHPHSLTPRQCSLSWTPLSPDYPWPLVITPTPDAHLAQVHQVSNQGHATGAHVSFVEIPVTKKPTRAKKDKNMTSADHDAADEEVNETTVEHLTDTARTLQESGAPLALPARRVGTRVTLAPITSSITTSCIRHEEPEDVPQITTKDKGKGRDLTNLGLLDAEEEKDEGEDAEAEKSDEEGNEEKDADAGSNGNEDGELKKTDNEDNNEDNAAEVTMPADLSDNDEDAMEVDPTTPKRPTTTSKRRASASPTTACQMGKGLRKDITHASASSHQAPPSPTSDNLEDLQGAFRTMGGFARGKAMGVALNMADF
ncbi:hypothetical protein BDN71DRAFT_1506267, partial [Pleurotus eryngii]